MKFDMKINIYVLLCPIAPDIISVAEAVAKVDQRFSFYLIVLENHSISSYKTQTDPILCNKIIFKHLN